MHVVNGVLNFNLHALRCFYAWKSSGRLAIALDCVVDFTIPYTHLSWKFEVCRIIELSSMKAFINSITSKFISQRCQKVNEYT